MTMHALITGTLVRDPERKTTKAGKPYASATVRDGFGDAAVWWRLFAFRESAVDELLALHDGDAVAASGSFKAELYNGRDGARISLSIFADRVISPKPKKRTSKRINSVDAQRPLDEVRDPDLDDDLPSGWQ